MKWSLLVGRFWGTEIRLHVSMLLLIPYTLWAFQPETLADSLRALVLISAIFVFVALHEVGHTLAARLYGIQVTSIVLWPLGGFANLTRQPEKVLPDMVISAAGPLTNLLLAIGLGSLAIIAYVAKQTGMLPAAVDLLWRWEAFTLLVGLTIANLSLALFNLLPIYPLDGGQILRGLLKAVFGEKNADGVMLVLSLPLALALTAGGLLLKDIILILTGLLLVLAGVSLNPRLLNNILIGGLYLIDRGGYYLKRLDFDPAAREYTRAIQRSPNRAGLYISRAVTYMNLMEIELAGADVRRALEIDAKNHVAWALNGELLSMQKDDQGAMDAFNQAVQLQTNWSIGYLDRGGRYQERGDFANALADMNRAVELGKGSPITYLLRSLLHFEMGNMEGFRSDADQALRYAPEWMLAFPELFLNSLEGHLDWALAYYERAMERMPQAYQVYQGRGDACRANSHPDWAIADYQRAIERAPRRAELYLARGRAYLQVAAANKIPAAERAAAAARAVQDLNQAAQRAGKAHIRRQAEELLRHTSLIHPTPDSSAPAPTLEQSGPAA